MQERQCVPFICAHNSARGHMAGGWLRHLAGDRLATHRAGTESARFRPLATRAMDKVGSDIADLESTTVDRYLAPTWDYVITVFDQVPGSCPYFPGGKRQLHWSLPAPCRAVGTDDERLATFRRIRDIIRDHVEHLIRNEEQRA